MMYKVDLRAARSYIPRALGVCACSCDETIGASIRETRKHSGELSTRYLRAPRRLASHSRHCAHCAVHANHANDAGNINNTQTQRESDRRVLATGNNGELCQLGPQTSLISWSEVIY
eukprot:6377466-Pyramimonas_sp.AAC.1